MPIYEEKLISPFAIRFTQNHIRTTFRDGRSVEATVQEIEELPGTGDYDVILHFPFPAIEIVRWHAERLKDDGKVTSLGEVPTGDHWFTLDNRRLYCLQRVAAACWPRRAAVAVQLLYASRGSIRNKCDTTTNGLSVTIANHQRDSPIRTWNWREEVFCNKKDKHIRMAIDAILLDDAKPNVDALSSVPGETCSAVARALKLMEAEAAAAASSQEGRRTPTTAEPSEDSETASSVTTPRSQQQDQYRQQIEEYAWWAIEEISQQLSAPGNEGYIWITNWNETYAPFLGSLKAFLASRPDQFTIIPGKGRNFRVETAMSKSGKRHSRHPQKKKQHLY
jgi:hypothetical protein